MPERSRDLARLADTCDLAAALIALGLLVIVSAGSSGVPRILLALAFACYVPGRAIVSNWPRLDAWSVAAMPVVFSLAALTLLAAIALWAHYWHPLGLFQAEAAASLAGIAVGLLRRHQNGGGPPPRAPGADPRHRAAP